MAVLTSALLVLLQAVFVSILVVLAAMGIVFVLCLIVSD